MTFPRPVTGFPRDMVGQLVTTMLQNEQVGSVTCIEAADGTYSVTPHPRTISSGSPSGPG